MLNNYFLIRELAGFLDKNIRGRDIAEIFSQEKNKLIISFSPNFNTFLEFSADKDLSYIVLKKDYSKAKKNYINLFTDTYGLKVKCVTHLENERAIIINLGNNLELLTTMIPNKSNLFLIKDDIIVNAFKNKQEYEGKPYLQIFQKKERLSENNCISIKNYIKTKYYLFGKNYISYILNRLNVTGETEFNEELRVKVDTEFGLLENELKSPEFILYKKNGIPEVSLLRLNSEDDLECIEYDNVNKLIEGFLKSFYQREKHTSVKTHLTDSVNKELANAEKKIKSIRVQIEKSEDSKIFKEYGEIILSNSTSIKRGDIQFEYFDEDRNEKIEVKLNPALSPVENANKYFEKYKHQKNSLSLLKSKLDKLQKEKTEIENKLNELEQKNEIKELMKMKKKVISIEDDETSSLFRKFILNESYEVWVGKNSASNDLLTMRYSAQNDLWFHVRGASGSHTVLKKNSKSDIPDKKTIEIAASIAAYYSKARNASNVPVAYCEKKYVKKRKGFKEGSVTMEREKVIFVKPGLPDN
jgi:predicted ribosome quality control (RQC) complex YloA/Tae2 family protein